MSPALRERPFRLACAAATSVSALQRAEPDHTLPAPANRRHRPLIGSGR
ncbi:hypothetical protein OG698_37960 [Streptomyces sp. NBC_01003]|nr:hypothetical protein OG698_37960 [Streptomyces sp. NBC_01003]